MKSLILKRGDKAWDRFWSKVNKGPDCWEWTGALNGGEWGGYGSFWIGNKIVMSHRIAWSMGHGKIQKGMFICHTCDNPACVRPSHLFLGTPSDNLIDSSNKGRAPGLKITNEQVKAIRNDTRLLRLISKEYGVEESTISRIKNRVRRKHVE